MEDEVLREASKVLTILSKYDGLKVFLQSVEGIEAETDAPEKIGLTKKQYYTRLKQLVDAGLIEKSKGKYVQTTLGRIIYEKSLQVLFEQVRNAKKLQMLDVLKSSGKFDMDEIYRLLQIKVDEDKARMFMDYDTLVNRLVERMDNASSEILCVTRFFNEALTNAIIEAQKRGVNVRMVIDRMLVEEYTRERAMKEYREKMTVTTVPFYPDKVDRKVTDVPFSFMVIDGKEVCIELINASSPEKFYAGVCVCDEMLAKQMVGLFETLYAGTAIARTNR
ncbi:MAG: phospholipase D-like domain-containing protein [Candidatus Nitrosocaldus sp.]|nr:phospholipase D-like domain-containing protein [Candidatus Nitrosocaldus sp.]MDW8000665.1 phospholipase D-like domain-containing protein [Candidatus Nitrosocaldus sp.]